MGCKKILRLVLLALSFLVSTKSFCEVIIDSFLRLKGADRTYELYHTYGAIFTQKTQLAKLNKLVDREGQPADKLTQYYWMEKRLLLDSIMYSHKGVAEFQALLKKAEEIPNYYMVAGYYMAIGVVYNKLGEYNKSFENLLLCLDALQKDPEGRYFEQCWWLHLGANKYYEFKDYDKAVELAKIAQTLNFKYTPDGVWFERVNANLVGMSYLRKGNYDSAKVWLEKTKWLATKAKDTTWLGIAIGNLGTVYYLQNNCKAAIQNYQQAIPWCQKGNVWDNVAAFSNNLADCYIRLGNYTPIPALLKQSEEANRKETNNISFYANQTKLFTLAEAYYRATSQLKLAIQYTDSIRLYQHLYEEKFDINKKIKTEGEFAYRSKELQNKLLQNETKLQKRTLVFGCIGVLFLAFFTVFYVKRLNLRKKLAEKNKEILETQLTASKKEILSFTQFIIEKNSLIDSYLHQIEELKLQSDSLGKEHKTTIEQLKTGTILTQEDWLTFKGMFEKVFPNFFQHLRTNYPDLTQAEIRFLAFTKLDISAKEMASLLGVSDEAIRTLRFRLKKKLQMNDTKEIEQLVMNINH